MCVYLSLSLFFFVIKALKKENVNTLVYCMQVESDSEIKTTKNPSK